MPSVPSVADNMNNTAFPLINITPVKSDDTTHALMCQSAYAAGQLEGFLRYYVAYGDLPGMKVTDRDALKKHIIEKIDECYAKSKARYPVD
jgi:hypothetical protein